MSVILTQIHDLVEGGPRAALHLGLTFLLALVILAMVDRDREDPLRGRPWRRR